MKRLLLTLLLLFGTHSVVVAGNFEDGLAAFERNDYATAFAKFTKAAEAGNTSAQFRLAIMYAQGKGVPEDDIKLMFWLTKAAKAGNAEAQYELAGKYERGSTGVPQDAGQAVTWYTKAAEQGNAGAQMLLAMIYQQGQGVPQDFKKAAHWYTKAAEAGDASSQVFLGQLYENGQGVTQDIAQAERWYTKAAEEGKYNLAMMYILGPGVGTDGQYSDQAVRWLTKAADEGNSSAQARLAEMYEDGRGVPKDDGQAVRWYTKAAEAGHSGASFNLGLMYSNGQGVTQDYGQAAMWYTKAAEAGHRSARFNLGVMYYNGQGVPQDYGLAVTWYTKAAEAGSTIAQFNLASMYYGGQGIPQDYVLAHMWANLAAFKNSEYVKKRDAIATFMTPTQIAEAQKLAREWKPTTGTAPTPQQETGRSEPAASGTGFVVSRQGHVLTNHHVIEGCTTIRATTEGRKKELTVVGADAENDLAVLQLPAPASSMARFRDGRSIRSGDGVVVVGFPLHGLLSSEANVTTGTVSALAGIGNNTRFLQITAPVQPGNSGGPLLDHGGNVVGIVVSKLNAMKIAKVTGDIPQNINFAINGAVAKSFLDANSVEYELAPSGKRLESSDVGGQAKKFTLLLECFK